MVDKVTFWIAHRDTCIQITLHDGDSASFSTHDRDDEGWSSTEDRYSFNDGELRHEFNSAALDCDGRFDRSYEEMCHLSDIALGWQPLDDDGNPIPNVGRLPKWQTISRRQRDYSAEAMNY